MAIHKYPANAEDGPLAGDVNLTTEKTEEGDWPDSQIWKTGPGPEERHLYRLRTVAIGSRGGEPVYVFVRTLSPDDGP